MKFFDKYVNGTYNDETGTQKWEISDNPIESTHKSMSIPLHDNADVDLKGKFFVKGTPMKDVQPIYLTDEENDLGNTYLTSGPSVVFYDNYDSVFDKPDNNLHKHLVYNIDDYRKFIIESRSGINDLIQDTLSVIIDYYDDITVSLPLNKISNRIKIKSVFNDMYRNIEQSIRAAIYTIYRDKIGVDMLDAHTGPLAVDDTKIHSITKNVLSIVTDTVKAENSFDTNTICNAVSNYLIQAYDSILKNAVSYIMDKYTDSDYSDNEDISLAIKKSSPYILRLVRDGTYDNGFIAKPNVAYLTSEHDEIEPDDNYRMLVEQYNNNRARQQNITDGIKELGQ